MRLERQGEMKGSSIHLFARELSWTKSINAVHSKDVIDATKLDSDIDGTEPSG